MPLNLKDNLEDNLKDNLYGSERLASGYAFDRPPVHQAIIAALREHIPTHFNRALDLGCGAGLSTAALAPLTRCAYGIEPIANMLRHRRAVTKQAHFVIAQAEHLPFADSSFDLLTAAGSLNYADHSLFFPEAARVLTDDGMLVIYDFSEGRRLRDDERLEQWYEAFKQHYPAPLGYAMDVCALGYEQYGLSLHAYHEIEVAVPLDLDRYLRYVLSETCVEQALARGTEESVIRAWCSETLAEIFDGQPRAVLFDAYFALVSKKENL